LVVDDRGGEEGVLEVERWAELRREHFVRGVAIKELARRYGIDRNTVRRALRSEGPPVYRRAPRPSKLEPFKDEIHRLLKTDPRLPGQRVRELIAPLGFEGGKTIVDDYLRELRPLFLPPPRTFQRTVYRPGEICQFDLWEPKAEVPVGHGQTRRGWVVVACLGYSRAGAGALILTKQTPDLLAGIRRCLWSLGALPELLVWDRQSGLHARDGRPTQEYAAFCGQLRVDWYFCEPADPQAKGVVERMQDFIERSFEPGRTFANERDLQLQLDTWFDMRANPRHHKTLRCRPIDRLIEERAVMAPLPEVAPDTDRRWVLRVRPTRTCALTPATTRWTRRSSAGASRQESPTARSSPSVWTPVRSPAATNGPSRGTARSPPCSTPAGCAPAQAGPTSSRRSRSARWPAMTS
jgi:transposase